MPNLEYEHVRIITEGQSSLTPLERLLLDKVDALTLKLEEVNHD